MALVHNHLLIPLRRLGVIAQILMSDPQLIGSVRARSWDSDGNPSSTQSRTADCRSSTVRPTAGNWPTRLRTPRWWRFSPVCCRALPPMAPPPYPLRRAVATAGRRHPHHQTVRLHRLHQIQQVIRPVEQVQIALLVQQPTGLLQAIAGVEPLLDGFPAFLQLFRRHRVIIAISCLQ